MWAAGEKTTRRQTIIRNKLFRECVKGEIGTKRQAGNRGVVSASTKHDLINDLVYRISICNYFFFVLPSSSGRNPSNLLCCSDTGDMRGSTQLGGTLCMLLAFCFPSGQMVGRNFGSSSFWSSGFWFWFVLSLDSFIWFGFCCVGYEWVGLRSECVAVFALWVMGRNSVCLRILESGLRQIGVIQFPWIRRWNVGLFFSSFSYLVIFSSFSQTHTVSVCCGVPALYFLHIFLE